MKVFLQLLMFSLLAIAKGHSANSFTGNAIDETHKADNSFKAVKFHKADKYNKTDKNDETQLLDGVAKFPLPFHVSVQATNPLLGGGYEHLCGGSIIDKQIVVTTAHCFNKRNNPKEISIVAGSNLLTSSKGKRYQVSHIVMHDFFQPLMGSDIALLKIKKPLKFDGKYVDKIDFNVSGHLEKNTKAYLVGWGRAKIDEGKKLELVSFHTINTNTCRKRGFIYVSSTEVCAISYKGRGACDGESGGALVNTKFNMILGLMSYGRRACKQGKIYAFTYMYPLVKWTRKEMAKLLHQK